MTDPIDTSKGGIQTDLKPKPEFDKASDPRTQINEPAPQLELPPPENAPAPTIGGAPIRVLPQETNKQLQERIDKTIHGTADADGKEKSEEDRNIEVQRQAAADLDEKIRREEAFIQRLRGTRNEPDRPDR